MGLAIQTVDRVAPAACRAAAYASCAGIAGPILFHVARGSAAHLGLYEDDFFYYVVLADHWVRLGKLTFDGMTLTNGVHPLWFAVILALRVVCGGVGAAFFAGVGLVLFAAMVATYEALRRFAQGLGAKPSVAAAVAALQCLAANQLIASGMEVAIAVPAFAWLLSLYARDREITPARAFGIGLWSSLAILARLDLAIAVALLALGWTISERPERARAARVALAFGAGLLPVVVDLAVNRAVFGAALPMSALAKQMRTGFAPNPSFVHSLVFDTVYGNRVVPAVAVGIVLWVVPKRRLSPSARVAAGVALAFPVMFFGMQLVFTNWCLFAWYAYPLVTASVATLVLSWDWAAVLVPDSARAVASAIGLAFVVASVSARGLRFFVQQGPKWTVADNTLTAMGFELAQRMKVYPGRLAMGDKAAGAAFVLGRPMVQLEGLVADRAMIEHIRRGDSLAAFAGDYSIDYLVVSAGRTPPERRDGCWIINQPNVDQAGPASPKSRTRICADPIIHFLTPHGPHRWSRWRGLETFVFDLRGDRRRALGTP